MDGLYRLAARRQLVDYGHVQVAVEGHGQGPRDGRGRHHQDVGRLGCLESQPGPLVHPEAVLFVDDHESQMGEDHIVLYDRVGAYEDVYLSAAQPLVYFPSLFCLCTAGQQGHPDLRACKRTFEIAEMLYCDGRAGEVPLEIAHVLHCEHLRGSHDTGLIAVVHCDESRQQRHHCLAAAHVPLQEAVHLLSGDGVPPYLLDYPLLRPCKLVGQPAVAVIERFSHLVEEDSGGSAHPHIFLPEEGELEEEEFFELETVAGGLEAPRILGKMDVGQSKCYGGQFVGGEDLLGKGFLNSPCNLLLEGLLEAGEYLDGDAVVAELVGAGVYADEGGGPGGGSALADWVEFRMDHVPAAVEDGGLSEYDVLAVGGELVLDPFYPLEEY